MTTVDHLEQMGIAMMKAWARVKKERKRRWSEWMIIGEGMVEGRNWAIRQAGSNGPEGKGYNLAFAEWLTRYKVDDMDKSDRAKLLQLMEERPAVEAWRADLPDEERLNLNNPTSVWRKWNATTRVKKPKSPDAALSAGESRRARGLIEQLQARVEELEQELKIKAEQPAPPAAVKAARNGHQKDHVSAAKRAMQAARELDDSLRDGVDDDHASDILDKGGRAIDMLREMGKLLDPATWEKWRSRGLA
jgi:hypothetical protein